ncbi:MAG TPA: hypothetical protein VFX60_00410, partial [Micromonospora sp.]|nr:hypothetical protein [Micromonospora sp.]
GRAGNNTAGESQTSKSQHALTQNLVHEKAPSRSAHPLESWGKRGRASTTKGALERKESSERKEPATVRVDQM